MFELFTFLNNISPLAIIGLLCYIVYMLISNKQDLTTIQDNHLHSLPDIAEAINRLENAGHDQFKLLNDINNHLAYIKARMNGKE